MKKIFSIIVTLCFTMTAAAYVDISDIAYLLHSDGTAEVMGPSSSYDISGAVSIPYTITIERTTYVVTRIRAGAFIRCTGITSISIPGDITSIEKNTFMDCTGLSSVRIGYGVTSIGENAFSGCSAVTSIEIPYSVTSIGNNAFYGCSSLTSIVIPPSVTSISPGAFSACPNTTSVVVDAYNTTYDSRGNCNAIIETATNTLVAGCRNTTIPNSVSSIGNYAFRECTNLTSIVIPSSVTSIGYAAFYACSGLTSIMIPNSVTAIGDYAFASCHRLTSLEVDNCVPPSIALNTMLFGPHSIVVPNGSLSAYQSADYWNTKDLSERYAVSILFDESKGMVDIAGSCDFSVLTATPSFGYQFTHWSDGNTNNPRIITITQDTTFTALFDIAHNGSCGENLTWSYADGVLTISGTGAMDDYTSSPIPWLFFLDSITSVVLPEGITHIGNSAFANIKGLRSISIPASVKSIGADAFAGDTQLYDIFCYSQYPPEAKESSFANYNAYLHVYCDYQRYYTADIVWSKFSNIECMTDVETIEVNQTYSKFFRDGHIYIRTADGQLFDATGRRVE